MYHNYKKHLFFDPANLLLSKNPMAILTCVRMINIQGHPSLWYKGASSIISSSFSLLVVTAFTTTLFRTYLLVLSVSPQECARR